MRLSILALALTGLAAPLRAQTPDNPPVIRREFRGVWLVTVNNGDWPSKPGLSTWEQQQELLAMLNKAAELKLNAIVFHVRPGADAFYESPYEPWSQFLTGVQGRPPEPKWDPLAFVVDEAHKRGIEVHAWFNPYRAHYTKDTAVAARTSIIHTNPRLVMPYARFIWMDPGEPDVRRRAVRVITDVVRRYDIDGVHIDDYFYPYPENDSSGATIEFPDSVTYAKYVASGGKLSKSDWRRQNVDDLVEAFYKSVKAVKPWVKVGVSPFGIWRPGNPPTIKGFDAYEKIYADSKKWLQNGWLDYLAPQLYWAVDPPDQSYPVLLDWWASVNTKERHIWAGNYTGRVGMNGTRGWRSDEIVRQVELTRAQQSGGVSGNIHFPMNVFMKNPDSLDEKLSRLYAEPALVPASPWLSAKPPGRPSVIARVDTVTGDRVLRLTPAAGEKVWLWTVQTRGDSGWTTEVLPGSTRVHRVTNDTRDAVVSAVDRVGNASARIRVVVTAPTLDVQRRGSRP
jgi:uncharacterized lipoprotein YddW (UPF0748 family)